MSQPRDDFNANAPVPDQTDFTSLGGGGDYLRRSVRYGSNLEVLVLELSAGRYSRRLFMELNFIIHVSLGENV